MAVHPFHRVGGGNRQTCLAIAAAIRDELVPENLPRLDAFMGQAAQAERLRQAKQPAAPADKLMSLAVSGWLLGSPSAEAKARLEKLLARFGDGAPTPEQSRDLLAVRVLEDVGTPEARKVLELLVRESPGWWVTREAKAALERLNKEK